ncbi:MAG: ATP-binding cassette domain-containing protein [Cyclobacteriaceae bacterium]|nr:ATP-binding cassette domain-containing protein [Cyclobacteriaceae bacterium]
MNEDTLKALTQLLALVTLQDGVVTETERNYVINLFRQDLDPSTLNFHLKSFDRLSGYDAQKVKTDIPKKPEPITLTDTVKTLAICNKLNKILEIKQKAFILVRVLQLIAVDGHFSVHKKRIIEIISAVFNFSEYDLEIIQEFVFYRPGKKISHEEILIINDDEPVGYPVKHVHADLSGELIFLKIASTGMYLVKYYGEEEILLNGFIMNPGMVYIFNNGSAIKTQLGRAIYYSDLIRKYLKEFNPERISLNADAVSFQFPDSEIGLRRLSISEEEGRLTGILGASGSGKTTLLNLLAGINKPSEGVVRINGIDIHTPDFKRRMEGMIGYISQDDMLIEELTVYQNLFFNARLCFADLEPSLIQEKIYDILKSLGLWERKDMHVGNVFSKKISGGQRKRLNIALELMREPSILFVDEPTSGLSSRDSENVMDLLKELTYRGKLVFAVIHQPSSDIYKLFDRIIILDDGGYLIYYGNPVEAVTYFKSTSRQLDKDRGICPVCGNVNTEQIFNIVEEKLVDEYGNFTDARKVKPAQWAELYHKTYSPQRIPDKNAVPDQVLKIPSRLGQLGIFIHRDFLSKLSDRQYMMVNLLVAPALSFILAGIVRYQNALDHTAYYFRLNDNIPVYFIMSIIVALFLGLMVSAEEIIHDRKILKREGFLNLSRNSYLLSKLFILFGISAIQSLLFVIVGNLILEIKGMFLPFWLILFTVSGFGNLLGLNLSDTFKSTVTVYILIPLLIIPQMVLSGLFVSFNKIHESIGNKAVVPLVADLMTSRWAFEAISVYQFIHNDYESLFYPMDQQISQSDFKSTYFTDKLEELTREILLLADEGTYRDNNTVSVENEKRKNRRIDANLAILENEFRNEQYLSGLPDDQEVKFSRDNFTPGVAEKIFEGISRIRKHYQQQTNEAIYRRDKMFRMYENDPFSLNLGHIKNEHYNEKLADIVRNTGAKDRVIDYRGRIVQLIDPVFQDEIQARSPFDYRTPLFAPEKQLFGIVLPTITFNLLAIWLLSAILYFTLYFQVFRRGLNKMRYGTAKYLNSSFI